MEKKEPIVTYFLGAGASYNAMPVVDELKILCSGLINIFCDQKNLPIQIDDDLCKKIKYHLVEMKNHPTIDTYAKKIFLKYGGYSNEYFLVKQIICAMFVILESFPNLDSNNKIFYTYFKLQQGFEKDNLSSRIEKKYDERYDGFFSYFLEQKEINYGAIKGKVNVPFLKDNINIISWNYDSNIEKSFLNFRNENANYWCFEGTHSIPLHYFDSDKIPFQVIKLNGTANYIEKYDPLGKVEQLKYTYLDSVSENVILEYLINSFKYRTIISSLEFAWEKDSNSTSELDKDYLKSAQEILNQTDYLIIVGYSFPAFNREIDKFIFSSEHNFKKVYYQVSEKDINIKERILSTINSGSEKIQGDKIFYINDLSQFYIPLEI